LKQALLGELLTLPFVPLQFEESGRHQTESRLRIGLAWASRTAKGTDATSEKAVPQERFLALFDGLDAEFVSFQREPSSEESNVLEGHLGARILADAVLDRSDQTLVLREVLALACMVTVSATSAHIAAAFGVPVILVAARRKHQQWFWRAQGEHGKAFYPTVQVCLGEGRTWWECCLEQARDQLRATLNAVRIAG
jgi:ADP-heptose:LPS heptosyltransferase